jgi:hypothetical protein
VETTFFVRRGKAFFETFWALLALAMGTLPRTAVVVHPSQVLGAARGEDTTILLLLG